MSPSWTEDPSLEVWTADERCYDQRGQFRQPWADVTPTAMELAHCAHYDALSSDRVSGES